ncbi:hypothetical protein HUG15_13890 [Salicibibacter cibarius]|uniref:Polysaccharide chain length determinant N-terminal domain-containing protein n=1 Tax=Salicibibacter cibarius TaxID=2743000 RepID=A0A7T6Z3W7_9BACI|nr:hypothetical protein HUG15_13890 [Salicibibacter cibarius]
MEETISLKEIFETLKKRWRMIAGITIGAVLLSAINSTVFRRYKLLALPLNVHT